ncbi:MAG: prepilin-type N-terminal cleavage/methylation protein [Schumannella sp.]|nr:prepilin-type N-terminal cleavage/methylation protein [Schumannella sp.]
MTSRRPVSRLRTLLQGEEGIGLVEVIVALMIFSIVSLGMAYSIASLTRMTKESTQREVAANLASAEIDRLQSMPDTFGVYSQITHPVVDGVTYTVDTNVGWVSTSGSTGNCGSGGGNLQYKAVNVEVTWPGMYLLSPVRADSALGPRTRINDPSYATILVSVVGADGTGRSAVTVRVTPESGGGGSPITDTIDPTDVDGCTYILKVAPGKYKIEVEKAGYIDFNQVTVPAYTQQDIVAGATFTAGFQYDNAGTFAMKYAATSNTAAPAIPSNLETTYTGGLNPYVTTTPVPSLQMHPYTGGYQVIAGDPAVCKNTDPGKWTGSGSGSGSLSAGIRAPAVSTPPGGSATLPVPMGVLNVKIPNTDSYISAVQQTGAASAGNPGCVTGKTYTFSTKYVKNTTVPIALPYGKWKIYTGASVGALTTQNLTPTLTVLDGVVSVVPTTGVLNTGILGNGNVTSDIVTLDPRVKNP